MASNQEEPPQEQQPEQQQQQQQQPEQQPPTSPVEQEKQNPTAPQPTIPAPAPTPTTASDTTTITPHPRRGKFLSPPTPNSSASPAAAATAPSSSPSAAAAPSAPATPSAKSRGKFLGAVPPASGHSPAAPSSAASTKPVVRGAGKNFQTLASSSSSSSPHAGGGGNGTHPSDADDTQHPSLAALRSRVAAARSSTAQKRRRLIETREKVFRNLDEAEDVVLGLLRCASEAAGDLRDMTCAAGGGGEEKKGSERASFRELAARVRENGRAYLAGVKRLHELLAPHAPLVKSYRNHRRDDDDGNDDDGDGTSAENDKTVTERIIANATSNMYAARVEKRLAAERSEILKEMLRLEKREALEEGGDGGNAAENEKRKGNDNNEMHDGDPDVTKAGSERKLEAIAVE